jgi:organic radical activating enzyme
MQDIRRLVRLLRRDGFRVQVETNGTRYYPLAADWLTVSPKPKAYFVRPEFLRLAKEVKLVVTKDLSLAILGKMRAAFPNHVPIILQPESNRRWSQKRALRLLRGAAGVGLDNIRVSLQLHRILGIR